MTLCSLKFFIIASDSYFYGEQFILELILTSAATNFSKIISSEKNPIFFNSRGLY